MEQTNHPFRKEDDRPNLQDYVPAVNLQGCIETMDFRGVSVRQFGWETRWSRDQLPLFFAPGYCTNDFREIEQQLNPQDLINTQNKAIGS